MYVSVLRRGVPVFLLVSGAMGQESVTPAAGTAVPGAAVTIEPQTGGACLVRVTMTDEAYPVETLRARLAAFVPAPRGLRLTTDELGGKGSFRPALTAVFGTDGLVTNGTVRLEPVAAALANEGPGRIGRVRVVVTPFVPTKETLRDFLGKGVRVTGAPMPGGFEYDLDLAADRDPIPDRPAKPEPIAPPRPVPPATGPSWPLLLVPAVAGGALVYSLILRRSLRRR